LKLNALNYSFLPAPTSKSAKENIKTMIAKAFKIDLMKKLNRMIYKLIWGFRFHI